jgi:hypothetical protein
MDRKKASMTQVLEDDDAGPAQARQGRCNICVVTEVTRERENN